MHYYIDKIKKEIHSLAQIKKKRALDSMNDEFQAVFLLLPILLHYHHPKLPGYIPDNDQQNQDMPVGIAYYTTEPETQLRTSLMQEFSLAFDSLPTPETAKISALYSMGSTCTIGQSRQSDLDIWLCIEDSLSEDERQLLQRKCHLIEQWSAEKGVQLTLFIVNVDRFRQKHHECLMGENCGSAQHMLLLEEFYRSAHFLAGKLLLWYVIPSNLTINGVKYRSYDELIHCLVESKTIVRDEWIDFGSLIDLSAEEYFGASLWQLYKSIDSPFKAVLKTLLLESYSWDYPKSYPIAYEMKSLIQHSDYRYSYLDSYYMLFHKLTLYLTETNDLQRLKLARVCFYFKVNEKLSEPVAKPSWRRTLLQELVNQWDWSDDYIHYLDQAEHWKIDHVRDMHDMLLQAMMRSYRNLLNFGRRNNLDSVVSPQDLAVLTRKLYASYEVLSGKITVLNANIPGSLAEDALTFIHVRNDRVNRAGWYVYKQRPILAELVGHQYLEYNKSLLNLMSWCYFNGLIFDKTELYYRDVEDYDSQKIEQLYADLSDYFPIKVEPVSEEALYSPCEIRHLAIMINLENDPTETFTAEDFQENSFSANVLNYGNKEINLVQSIDLLYRNSWNELRVLHFSGELAVLDALKTLLSRMHKDADLPNSIKIFCYSKHLQNEIKTQIQTLMDRSIDLRLRTTQSDSRQFKPLRINGSSWYLFFERLGVSVHQFDNAMDFYGAVSNNKVQGRALNILDEANELPVEIDSVACEGIIQFFFEDTDSGFDLYILNEYNQVEIYRNCNGNKENMVNDVNSFYALSDVRFTFATSTSVNFNLPQFYLINSDENDHREIVPFNPYNN